MGQTDLQGMRRDVQRIFKAGLQAAAPGAAMQKHCRRGKNRLIVANRDYDLTRFRHIHVIGAGKGTAPMAAAMEEILGERIESGIINVKYGYLSQLKRIRIVEAGHPVPDEVGEKGAAAILKLARDAGQDDLIICLISGGGSALLPLPAEGLTLADKQNTIRILMECGATIHEINAIRKHTSRIKGGRLTRAVYPATLITLILSDVVGDDLDVIASGPTVPDSSRFDDCLQIIDKFGIEEKLPGRVLAHLKAGSAGEIPETPKADDPAFLRTQNQIIANNFEAIMAARKTAESLGYNTLVLSSMIQGETKEVARVHGAIAREIVKSGHPIQRPAVILSGGETTVTISGTGLGGRNQEFSLAAAIDIADVQKIVVLCAGTDGSDGPTEAAGAIADSDTLARARVKGIDPQQFLRNNDSYHFFKQLGDLLITGPTNTNVMDLRIILVA